jgi:hypothetical protein
VTVKSSKPIFDAVRFGTILQFDTLLNDQPQQLQLINLTVAPDARVAQI